MLKYTLKKFKLFWFISVCQDIFKLKKWVQYSAEYKEPAILYAADT